MASDQAFSAHDLRSDAVDSQREKAHRAKVAAGQEELGRPLIQRQTVNAAIRRNHGKDMARSAHRAQIALRHDIRDELPSDSSAPTSDDEFPSPPADPNITYSFDAPRGPGRGSEILGQALAKAVEKFEGKEVENLVKEEYEVVRDESGQDVVKVVEDDFELV